MNSTLIQVWRHCSSTKHQQIILYLSLSLSLSHLRPPQSTLKLKHLQPPQNSTTSDPSRLSQDPPYISEPTIYLCSRMSSIITKSSSQHHTLLSELWIFWIDASWAGKSNWIDVGCMGKDWFFFFFGRLNVLWIFLSWCGVNGKIKLV